MKEVSLVKMESEDTSASMPGSVEKYPAGSPIRSQLPTQVPTTALWEGKVCRLSHSAPWLGKCYH